MLQHRPLIVVCAGFIVGILLATGLGGNEAVYGTLAFAGLIWLAVDSKRAILAALIVSISVGGLRTLNLTARSNIDVSHYSPVPEATLSGAVEGEPAPHASSLQFTLACDTVTVEGRVHAVNGRVAVVAGTMRDDTPLVLHDGDRVTFTAHLDRPRPASNPSGFSWADMLSHRGIWTEAHLYDASAITVVSAGRESGFASFAVGVRQTLLADLAKAVPPIDYSVLSGVLFGLRSEIPPAVMGAFIATGTVHILATAGLHIGVILLLLSWAGHLIGAPRKLTAGTSIGLLWLFDLMAGGRPAVTRAVIVATIYLAATVVERAPEVLNSLGAAALFILFLQPTALIEPGFQMSFLTVLTLVALLPVWQHCWEPVRDKMHYKVRKVAGWGIDLVGMCLVAQIGTGPIVASEFHILPLYSVAANLLVVPMVFLLIPCGLAVTLLSVASTSAASGLAMLTVTPLISAILWTTKLFGSGPGASMAVGDFPDWMLVLYYVTICGGGFVWQHKLAEDHRRSVRASAVDPSAAIVVHPA